MDILAETSRSVPWRSLSFEWSDSDWTGLVMMVHWITSWLSSMLAPMYDTMFSCRMCIRDLT